VFTADRSAGQLAVSLVGLAGVGHRDGPVVSKHGRLHLKHVIVARISGLISASGAGLTGRERNSGSNP